MLFDFHTHAFADSIAERAMASLLDTAKNNKETEHMKAYTDGTISELRMLMQENGISRSLLLPIATKPSQQTTINNWAASVMENDIYSCGTVHPDAENFVEEVERIKSLGLCGVKLHPEYQFFRPDEERVFPIYRKAAELGLFVVFHAGWDPAGKGDILAPPRSFAHIAEKFPELNIVAAHMGGMRMFDEVEDCLAGKFGNVYFDTAAVTDYISPEQLLRIIGKHGADKILFASDAPWDDPQNEVRVIDELPLSKTEKDMIFYKNAERILNI
ncbi:MAG: amidohydrolase [Ruminococcus sp.]|nr:amidohydrolase [Ruminococcus sp.]